MTLVTQPPADPVFDRQRLRVLVDYSTGLRWQMTATAVIIAALLLTAGATPPGVAAWLAVTIVVREWRAARLVAYSRDETTPIGTLLHRVTTLTLALGAAYGASALFMAQIGTAYDAILTMILLSLSAGAVSTTFTVLPAFWLFAGALAVPCAAMWALQGTWLGAGIAMLTLLFAGVQLRFAKRTSTMFEESYRMRQANTELLARLSEQSVRLARARDAAVTADLAKSRFLAAASHDLRQPMQSLALNSGALSRLPLDAEGRQIAAEMGEGIEALRRMLDALLDLSQLDAGAAVPELQPLALDRLLDGLGQRARKSAQAKGLTLEVSCPPGLAVTSDVQMLQRVISNLLDNAIKFTVTGGIALRAEGAGERVRITVQDTGCGIPEADRQRVFEDLVQLHNPQRDRRLGHGLGLGIVRRLCALLGIELGMTSTPGKGTRFDLDLPTADATGALLAEGGSASPALVERRVLVLDDDESVRVACGKALRSLGCEVMLASTLDEALAACASVRPDVALVDYRLGGEVDGLGAIRRLRERVPSLAALIVSADNTAALREEAQSQGIPLLRKPVTDTVLALSIHRLLAETVGARRVEA